MISKNYATVSFSSYLSSICHSISIFQRTFVLSNSNSVEGKTAHIIYNIIIIYNMYILYIL